MGHRICREVLGCARIARSQAIPAMLPTQIADRQTAAAHDASMQFLCGVLTERNRKSFAVAQSGRYGEEIADFSSAIAKGRHPKLDLGESPRNVRTSDHIVVATRSA